MSRPALTDAQVDMLINPGYERESTVMTPSPERLLPLIGQLRFELDGAEAGAPMTDGQAPLVDAAPWEAVGAALGAGDPQTLLDGWLDLLPLLRLASFYGQIEPGRYRLQNTTPEAVLDRVSGYGDMTLERAGFDAEGQVMLTEPHIRLLRDVQWRWTHDEIAEDIYFSFDMWPGPAIDPKRVYGDMSFIELDMHRILNLPVEERNADGFIELSATQEQELAALHLTLLAATQAFVENVALDLAADEAQQTLRRWSE
ncbi:hypothetical protein V8J82_16725 [Gymnodinialimonas sp. 2305UL16-5]|uniref:hypothetical protein n=1 Tax=Gymnodinialimonas mytili TaxID=3126503 RepID=UPI0030ADC074